MDMIEQYRVSGQWNEQIRTRNKSTPNQEDAVRREATGSRSEAEATISRSEAKGFVTGRRREATLVP